MTYVHRRCRTIILQNSGVVSVLEEQLHGVCCVIFACHYSPIRKPHEGITGILIGSYRVYMHESNNGMCDENVDDIIIASNTHIVASATVRQYVCLKRCRLSLYIEC